MTGKAIEIIGGRERRRRWSVQEKLRLVAATYEPGGCVKQVALSQEICPSLLFTWRRQVREGMLAAAPMPVFLPVQTAPQAATSAPEPAGKPGRRGEGQIEIELRDGSRLHVGADVRLVSLRRVLAALRG